MKLTKINKIEKEAQWEPFGGSLRHEDEDDANYRARLLRIKDTEAERNERLTLEYSEIKSSLNLKLKHLEQSNSILEHVDAELEKLGPTV